MAAASQYGFLISCESRISLHNSGPYKIGDDREMIVRDFMDFSESDFPWLDGVASEVPYNNLTVTMGVKDSISIWSTIGAASNPSRNSPPTSSSASASTPPTRSPTAISRSAWVRARS